MKQDIYNGWTRLNQSQQSTGTVHFNNVLIGMAGVKTSKQFIKSHLQCKIKKVFQMHIKYIYIPFYKSTRAHTFTHRW